VKFVSDTFKPRAVSHDHKFFFRRRWNVH
jgi:hypothetical protein